MIYVSKLHLILGPMMAKIVVNGRNVNIGHLSC
jgi:hypothetical protein